MSVYGNLITAINTKFTRRNTICLTKIQIDNSTETYGFENVYFKGVEIDCIPGEFIAENNCDFNNSLIEFRNGNIELTDNELPVIKFLKNKKYP